MSSSKTAPTRWLKHFPIRVILKVVLVIGFLVGLAIGAYAFYQTYQQLQHQRSSAAGLSQELTQARQKLAQVEADLVALQNTDQVLINKQLTAEINDLQKGFKDATVAYEALLSLTDASGKKSTFSAQLVQVLTLLSQRQYTSASARLTLLTKNIQVENERLAAQTPTIAANLPKSNTPPGSGSQRQVVETDVGSFQVDIIAADLNSTRVVVETASQSTCTNDCPVSSLADFVSRAGGFAGINGPYFCPAEYPSCAGKTNSFDTLLMNRQKTYFNSDNNVYSNVPAVIFSGSSARFVGQSSEWGRDTSPDSVIASQPLLLSGGEVRFGGDGDPKKGSRGNRSFIGTKGSTVYIGVVRTATVAETARVLKAMGLENALNLDSGGSTALMANGRYLAGPGRNTPFGIVLVRK